MIIKDKPTIRHFLALVKCLERSSSMIYLIPDVRLAGMSPTVRLRWLHIIYLAVPAGLSMVWSKWCAINTNHVFQEDCIYLK